MRVAIVFFGVARSLSTTLESIKRNIYACNPSDAFSFYTIASLNLVESITNPRTGEDGVALNAADVFLLDADVYTLVRQTDVAIAEALAAAQSQPDLFQNDWISVRNALHQLASLRRAWTVSLDLLQGDVDYFLFVRPDLMYLDKVNLTEVVSRFNGVGNIALPAWHSWGGFNDRFALADPAAARHYADRLSLVPEYCAKTYFHPESFLAYALDKGQCSVCGLGVRARRVRAHGAVFDDDFSAAVRDIPLNPTRFLIQPGKICFVERDERVMELNDGDSSILTTPRGALGASPASPALRLRKTLVDGYSRVSPLNGLPYLHFLAKLHAKRHVSRYLEIGTQTGASLRLAQGKVIAIDPKFMVDKKSWSEKEGVHLFEMTSDDFFVAHDPLDILGQSVDLAFIDGMHLSEFVLRDFNNVERYCSRGSVIVLHDAIPQNFEMTERDRRPWDRHDKPLAGAWTGDVWRIVPLLRHERPDLCIQVLDCPPTGLVLVSNLNPQYRMPPERLEELTHILTESEVPEFDFWSFIESVPIADSRKLL